MRLAIKFKVVPRPVAPSSRPRAAGASHSARRRGRGGGEMGVGIRGLAGCRCACWGRRGRRAGARGGRGAHAARRARAQVTHSNTFSQRPDRAQLEAWAAERNRRPLPKVAVNNGIPLPVPRERLTGVNFSIKPQAPPAAVQQHAQPPHVARPQKRPRGLARAAPASQAEVNTTAGLVRWARWQRPARPATLDWTAGDEP